MSLPFAPTEDPRTERLARKLAERIGNNCFELEQRQLPSVLACMQCRQFRNDAAKLLFFLDWAKENGELEHDHNVQWESDTGAGVIPLQWHSDQHSGKLPGVDKVHVDPPLNTGEGDE